MGCPFELGTRKKYGSRIRSPQLEGTFTQIPVLRVTLKHIIFFKKDGRFCFFFSFI